MHAPAPMPTPASLKRRQMLQGLLLGFALPTGLGLLRPGRSWAAPLADPFAARSLETLLALLHAPASPYAPEGGLLLQAPELAENGTSVPIQLESLLPDTQELVLIAEHNPYPLTLRARFGPGTRPRLHTRLRLAESTRLRVIAYTGQGVFTLLRPIKVIAGGCGNED